MPKHAALGGSNAYRWRNCPGSVRETADMVSPPSIYSEEGTAAHSVLEICLREERDPVELVDRTMDNGVTVSGEMAEAVETALLAVAGYRRGFEEHEMFLERSVGFPKVGYPDMFGTADVVLYGTNKDGLKELVVADYKHGKGMAVDAETDDYGINDQIGYYLIGAALDVGKVDVARGVVLQPRSGTGEPKEFVIDGLELAAWTAGLLTDADRTKDPLAPLVPGPWCQKTFCPKMSTCEARKAMAASAVHRKAVYDDVDVEKMDEAAFLEVLELADEILEMHVPWAKEVKAVGLAFIEKGGLLEGWKAIAGRSSRVFAVDDDTVVSFAELSGLEEDEFMPRKLLSVAQLEKLLSKEDRERLKALVLKKEGAPALVRSDNPKPALAFDRRSTILKGMVS